MADKVVVVRLRAAIGEYTSGLARAGGQTVTFGAQVAGAASRQNAAMAQARTTMANLAQGAAMAGKLMLAGIGGAMVVSAKAAIDFESSLTGVAKTVEGTAAQIEAVGSAMRRLSTEIPVNVNELNKIAELGGQLGVGITDLEEFTEVIAALGVTTNLSTDQAATGLARLANVIGVSQQDFDRLGSTIVDLGNNFATTESEILTFALRIAPAAQTVGATASEVLGLAAALSSMGVPAERGGTAVQTMFTIIASGARSGGIELEAMAAIVGITADEFQRMALEAPTDALVALAIGLGKANDAGRDVFAMMRGIGIMGRRAQAVLLAMSNNTDLLTGSLDMSNEAFDENSALFEEAARRYGTTASKIKLMANQFTDLRIELGQTLLPTIRTFLGVLQETFRWVRDNTGAAIALGKALLLIPFIGFAIGMQKMITAMFLFVGQVKTAVIALGGLRASMGALSLGAGGWATVIGVVLTAAIFLVGKAAFSAAKRTAELRENVEEFSLAVAQGVDPIEAFIASLDEISLSAASRGLEIFGLGLRDIGEAGAELQIYLNGLRNVETMLDKRRAAAIVLGDDAVISKISGELVFLASAIAIVENALGTAEIDVADKANKMATAVLIAGKQGTLSFEQLLTAAKNFLKIRPDAEVQDFLERLSPPSDDAITNYALKTKNALQTAGQSWEAFLLQTEEGQDRLTQFDKDIVTLAGNFADSLTDSFDEVRETLLEGFPAWDEYGDSAKVAMDKVIEAQDRMLADVQRWAPAQASLIGTVSAATLQWFDDLSPLEKGALGRLFANDPLEFAKFATDVDDNLAELTAAADAFLITRLPQILDDATLTASEKISALVNELKLPPGDAEKIVGAYEAGLTDFFNALPGSLGDDVRLAILALLDPSQSAAAIAEKGGMTAGWFIQGVEQALLAGDLTLKVAVEEGIVDPIVDAADRKFQNKSPSKVGMRIGSDFAEGISIGMASNIDTSMFQRIAPSFQAMMDQSAPPTVNVAPSGGDLIINHPHHPTDDLKKDLQRASVLAGHQRLAEVGTINNT